MKRKGGSIFKKEEEPLKPFKLRANNFYVDNNT